MFYPAQIFILQYETILKNVIVAKLFSNSTSVSTHTDLVRESAVITCITLNQTFNKHSDFYGSVYGPTECCDNIIYKVELFYVLHVEV